MTSNRIEPTHIQCPYCWETIEILVDCSVESQEYIEDCEVCCRPIQFGIEVNDEGFPKVAASGDNE